MKFVRCDICPLIHFCPIDNITIIGLLVHLPYDELRSQRGYRLMKRAREITANCPLKKRVLGAKD